MLCHARTTQARSVAEGVRVRNDQGYGYKKYVSSMYPGVFCVYSLDGVCEPGYIGIHSGYTLEYMRFFGGETDFLGGKHVCILK